jgi:hypothetical protein
LANGTNAYADTFLIASTSLSNGNAHMSWYNRTNAFPTTTNYYVGGSYRSSPDRMVAHTNYLGGGVKKNLFCLGGFTFPIWDQSDSSGMWVDTITSTSANAMKSFRNNANVATGTVDANGLPTTYSMWWGALNVEGSGTGTWSPYEFAFATIGDGLTDTDATNLYNIVQRYQTSLGRQV